MRDQALAAGIALAITLVSTAASAQSAGPTREVEVFRDWTTYEHKGAPSDICFATSQPRETEPTNANRETSYFYVSAWPKDGVRSEVSLKLGYEIQAGSDVTVAVGNEQFSLFPKAEKAFVSDPNEELKLINAMKRGSFMTVTATSADGTTTTDTYSLLGVTAAINSLSNCS